MSKNKPTTYKTRGVDRILEMIPGILTWLVLTSPIWLTMQLPAAMAFIIIFLDIYWLYRVVKTVILAIIGYHRMKAAKEVDWLARLKEDFAGQWEDYEHLFVIPSYKERGYVIDSTLKAIVESDYPKDKIRVMLCLEERDDKEILLEKHAVADKYRSQIAEIYVTEHPDGIEGEVVGAGSNRTWAFNHLMPTLEKDLKNIDKTIVTTLDSDFAVHSKLLPALTHKYLSTVKPDRKTYTGIFFYSNNYWQAPAPMRIISLSLSVGQMAELVENWKYVTFSSHSLNLRTLIDLDFWTIDHVNDDSHFYWKAFYHYKGDFQVIPHWIPIYTDAVLDETFMKTLENQYKQLQRWGYGVEHTPFILKSFFTNRSVPFLYRLERMLFYMRSNLFWATIAFITGFGALTATLINASFRETVLGHNLALYSSIILTIAIGGLIPMFFYAKLLSPPMPQDWNRWQRFWGRLQIVISPIVLMTFGTLPAIDSQTRLMLGKYMSFRVTRKFRKEGKLDERHSDIASGQTDEIA